MLTREQERQIEQALEKTGNIKGLEYIHRLKNELRSKVEYIHEQDEIIDDYKHRAEVAERALRNITERASCNICDNFSCRYYEGINYDYNAEDCIKWWLAQAEKEIAEEGSGKKEI